MLYLSAAIALTGWARHNQSEDHDQTPALHAADTASKSDTMPDPDHLTLRDYEGADLDACMMIWREASQVAHPFLSPDELDADGDITRAHYIPAARITMAELGGVPAGFIAMKGDYIAALFVHPRYHRKGIGRTLLDHVRADRADIDVDVYLDNRQARAFYRAAGFQEFCCFMRDARDRPLPVVRLRLAA